jgi:hypothetical protein
LTTEYCFSPGPTKLQPTLEQHSTRINYPSCAQYSRAKSSLTNYCLPIPSQPKQIGLGGLTARLTCLLCGLLSFSVLWAPKNILLVSVFNLQHDIFSLESIRISQDNNKQPPHFLSHMYIHTSINYERVL